MRTTPVIVPKVHFKWQGFITGTYPWFSVMCKSRKLKNKIINHSID